MTFPGTALGDQWTPIVAPHTVTPAEMKARTDDQINAMAHEEATWGHDFPRFFGYLATAYSVANANITFTAAEDSASAWASGVYTIPTAGLYVVSYSCRMSTNTTNNGLLIGLNAQPTKGVNTDAVADQAIKGGGFGRLAAGATLRVQQSAAATLMASAGSPELANSWFSIVMIGH